VVGSQELEKLSKTDNVRGQAGVPLAVRPLAVKAGVLSFFVVALVGWASGLSPFVCCKKAVVGGFLFYIVVSLAVKAVNAILLNVLAKKQVEQRKELRGDGKV